MTNLSPADAAFASTFHLVSLVSLSLSLSRPSRLPFYFTLDPFDTIKVRIQTSVGNGGNGNGGGGGALALGTSPLSSFRSLFQGMAAPLSSATLVNAIIFASYGSFTRMWEDAFEGGRHDGDGAFHGTMTSEGAVFIERGEVGLHELIRHHHDDDGDDDRDVRGNISVGDPSSSSSRHRMRSEEEERKSAPEGSSDPPRSDQSTGSGEGDGGGRAATRQPQNTLKIFACGAAAGTVQAFVICPMEHIKCRLQVAHGGAPHHARGHGGPVGLCASIVREHGLFRGLYRGMGVTLWRETPAFGMYFATYDTIKERVEGFLEARDGEHPIPSHAHAWAASALAGGISGAWTWVIIYPFDVIKTRIQTSPLDRVRREGMWSVGRGMVREHGWRHMFRGLGVTLARAFPVNAIIFPTYEFVLLQLGDGG